MDVSAFVFVLTGDSVLPNKNVLARQDFSLYLSQQLTDVF